MIKRALFLLVLFPFHSWAASSESGVTQLRCDSPHFAELKIKNYPAFSPLGCDEVQPTLESALKEVRELTGITFLAPRVTILNDEYALRGEYDWRLNELELRITQKEKPEKWLVSFYHELGHAVFASHIHKSFPGALTLEDVRDFRQIQAGYDELFADLVVAVLRNDPEVMVNALATEKENFDYLSFSNNLKLTEKLALGSHSRFSSLRKDLWELWVTPRMGNKPKLLSDLANIFLEQAKNYYALDAKKDPLSRAQVEITRLGTVLFPLRSIFILKNEKFCGKAFAKALVNGVRESYYAAIILQRPTATLNQSVMDEVTQAGDKIVVWLTQYTNDKHQLGDQIEKDKCYCVEGDAGGAIRLMGFQQITRVEEISCPVK